MESEFIQATINLPKPQKLVYDRSRIPSSADFLRITEMSRKIPLSNGKYAIVDDEDYELVSKFKWHYLPSNRNGYAISHCHLGMLNKKRITSTILLHRLIMRPPKGVNIDHISGNGLDCKRNNMRFCNQSENLRNSRPQKNTRSKYKGVSWHNKLGKWRAYINISAKQIHLGIYGSEIEAAHAYNAASIKYFGDFAYLNL